MSNNEQPPVNDLSGRDVVNFGKEVGRDSAKQALVWTLASFGTQVLRAVVNGFTKPKAKPPQSGGDWS